MRSISRTGPAGLPRATSRHDAARAVSPGALRKAQEADATMTPDGWGAGYVAPGRAAEAQAAGPVLPLAGALPAA
jgi:hypothetical protein